jgi:hypothetical protein
MTAGVQPGEDVLNDILGGVMIMDAQNREAQQFRLVPTEQFGQPSRGGSPASARQGGAANDH